MERTKFYVNIPRDGYNLTAYKDAVRYAMKVAKERDGINRIVFYIATNDNIDFLDELFSEQSIEALYKGYEQDGTHYCIRTKRTFASDHSVRFKDIVISFGMDADELYKLDDMVGVECVIAIPWLKDKIIPWVQRWDATEINNNPIQFTCTSSLSPVVRLALDNLTEVINLCNDALHIADDAFLKTTVRTLHKYVSPLDLVAIDSYLVVEKGWPSKHSQYFISLLRRLDEGHSFKGGETTGLKKVYQNWLNQIK